MYLPLAAIFRNRNFSYARQNLDRMQQDFEAGRPIFRTSYLRSTFVSPEELQTAQTMYKILTTTNEEYKLRIDAAWLSLYSNNNKFLESLIKKFPNEILEYSAPNPNLLDIISKDTNTVIVKKSIPYKYRITLGETTDSSFANWAKGNKDKVKMTQHVINAIEENFYTKGFYFYARDEKIIQLLTLMIGPSIRRIDKVICTEDLDK